MSLKKDAGKFTDINWYGLEVGINLFLILSLLFFLFWIILGIQRTMREELQFRNTPIVWGFFVIAISIYSAGFVPKDLNVAEGFIYQGVGGYLGGSFQFAFLLVLSLTYFPLMEEATQLYRYKRLINSIKAKQFKRAFENTSSWAMSFLIAFILYILVNFWPRGPEDPTLTRNLLIATTSLFLFMIRDGLVAHYILLGDRLKHSKFILLFYYLMAYLILPAIFFSILNIFYANGSGGMGVETFGSYEKFIISIFYPSIEGGFLAKIAPVFNQVLIAGIALFFCVKTLNAEKSS